MQYEVNMQALCALVHLSSKQDIRWYLNGVCVEFRETETVYIATDGHVLGRYIDPQRNETPASVIVPRDVIERIKLHKADHSAVLHVEDDGKRARLVYAAQIVNVGFAPLDGKFPDWRPVVPSETSGEAGHFDVELLGKFVKVNKVFGKPFNPGVFRLRQNGPAGAALVELVNTKFLGVIMPVRI